MAVVLSVRDVRDAIYSEARDTKNSAADFKPTQLLGKLFHDVFAKLVDAESPLHFARVFAAANASCDAWGDALRDAVYRDCVLRQIEAHRAALHERSGETATYWSAVNALIDWIAGAMWAIRQPDGSLPEASSLVVAEQALRLEIHRPEWTDAVVLFGQADAIWRAPNGHGWCVTELKLGPSNEVVDLAQVCLYHWMLRDSADRDRPANGLTLVRFVPKRRERFFAGDALEQAKPALINLIGRLAGVAPSAQSQPLRGIGLRPAPTADVPSHVPTPANADERDRAKPAPIDPINSLDNVAPSTPDPTPSRIGLRPAPHCPTPLRNENDENDERDRGKEIAGRLLKALAEYGVRAELAQPPDLGPAFHRIYIWPGRGVRVAKILQLHAEVQARLKLSAAPIISQVDGRLAFDIPRERRRIVQFEDFIQQVVLDPIFGFPALLVGVRMNDSLCWADLSEPDNCHFLIAGTTGSGKSQWLRAAVLGLIAHNEPATARIVLIDPKRSAFNDLSHCPHLLEPIVYPDETDPASALERLIDIVEQRYREMDGAVSLRTHFERTGQLLPRIVCFCDEYFDLIARGKAQRKAIEEAMSRICAKGRQCGVHMVMATQRPDRETVKGTLDSNLPARVALRVGKSAESKMINCEGAERLLGNGDLLYRSSGIQTHRLQGLYASPEAARQILAKTLQRSLAPSTTAH